LAISWSSRQIYMWWLGSISASLRKYSNGTIKVFKSGPVAGSVQSLDSRLWPGHRVWIGSAGSIFIFKKIQNGVVLVIKKSQWVATGFLTGFCRVIGSTRRVSRVMVYAIFSSTRLGFSPRTTRRAGPGFKTLGAIIHNYKIAWKRINES
jgi:hypothetical protein